MVRFLVYILILLPTFLHAEITGIKFKHITEKDGLSHGCVSNIIQDKNAFIWIGTENGLNRYNGYEMKQYFHDANDSTSLSHNFIRTIYEDPDEPGKILWIGTWGGGLNKFNLETNSIKHYKYSANDTFSISHNKVHCILKSASGLFWIGTEGGGLNRFDPQTGKFTAYLNDPKNDNSLSYNRIASICEDSDGTLWIGTYNGGGLNHFNPKTNSFVHHYHDPKDTTGIPAPSVPAVYKDSKGILWIGTNGGLCRYNRKNNTFMRHRFKKGYSKTLNSTEIWAIYEDKQNNLWIATSYSGLFKIDPMRKGYIHFENIPGNKNSLNFNAISSIYKDDSGILWVGTYCYGVNMLIPHRKKINIWQNIPFDSKSLGANWITHIHEDKNYNLWIATKGGGLNRFNKKDDSFQQVMFGSAPSVIKISDKQNDGLWIARYLSFTEYYPENGKFFNYYGGYEGMDPAIFNWINKLTEYNRTSTSITKVGSNKKLQKRFRQDEPGYVFIVAAAEGNFDTFYDFAWLTKNKKRIWDMKYPKSRYDGGSINNRIQAEVQYLDIGEYILHYQTNGEHNFDNWAKESPNHPELWGIAVFPITVDEANKIEQVIRHNHYTTNLKYPYATFPYVFEDRSGAVWCKINFAFDEDGFYTFDPTNKKFTRYEIFTDTLISKEITSVYEDRSGNLWFGTLGQGIIKRKRTNPDQQGNKKEIFVHYKKGNVHTNSICSNNIFNIFEDSKGYLWITSDNGLNKFDPVTDRFYHFSKEDGLASNRVYGIVEDTAGKFWISTENSISRYNPETNKFRNFAHEDGFLNLPFEISALLKTSTGDIFIGGKNGLSSFHPDSLTDNPATPKIVIDDFRIYNSSVSPGENSPIQKSIFLSEEVELNHDQDVFSFQFSALDYTNPLKNKYAYKMEGVDPEWVFTDASRNFATYTKLDPGKYTFFVKGSNGDGIWNEQGTSINITILPPWWKTWWAYSIYLILILILLYLSRKYDLKRQHLKNELELEHKHSEKLLEIDRMKSRFFANISHEFRTPLTLILGPIERLLSKAVDSESEKELSLMQRNAKRLQRLINQLLDLSKLESGGMALQLSKENIVDLVKQYSQSFESLAIQKGIKFEFKSDKDNIVIPVDRDKIEKILNNLLSNAFKFTPEGGVVEVAISEEPTPNPSLEGSSIIPLLGGDKGVGKGFSEFFQITISDTGIGIPADRLDKIFDRFYQIDDARKLEQEGTGIGLALTKELVELHRGEIKVQSELGRGTIFTILLPAGTEAFKGQEIIADQSAITADPETQEKLLTDYETTLVYDDETKVGPDPSEALPIILLVEDNQDMRSYICRHLKKDFEIIEAIEGQDGLNKATDIIPDLVISDVMMPKMDGFEFCQKIKTDQHTSHIPVILLTARAELDDRLEGLQTGADDYLIKPFEPKELLVRINNLIEQRKKLQKLFYKEFILISSEKPATSIDEKFTSQLMDICHKYLADSNFSVELLGKEAGLSRSQLHRKLKGLTGQSATEFINTLRLKRAALLIEQHEDNISQIAFEVGFNNLSYFAKSFKKLFGQSPSEYLNNMKPV